MDQTTLADDMMRCPVLCFDCSNVSATVLVARRARSASIESSVLKLCQARDSTARGTEHATLRTRLVRHGQKMRISTTIRLIEFLRNIVARAGLIDISTLILAVCIVI